MSDSGQLRGRSAEPILSHQAISETFCLLTPARSLLRFGRLSTLVERGFDTKGVTKTKSVGYPGHLRDLRQHW